MSSRAARVRRVAVCALLPLLAATCSPDLTLDEAARRLAKDGNVLVTLFHYMENKRITDSTGKDGNDSTGCPKGTARRSYQATADFIKTKWMTPAELADLTEPSFRLMLETLGYELDHSANLARKGSTIAVFRKKDPVMTFMLVVQSSVPNVEFVGTTDCLVDGVQSG